MARPDLERRDDRWERCIDGLDPIAGAHAVFAVLFDRVFPHDIILATELGQLRTFAFPSISGLLHATGEYERRGQKIGSERDALDFLVQTIRPDLARGVAGDTRTATVAGVTATCTGEAGSG